MITNSNQIELRHLRYFLVLANELHFHRAAEKLFISQPALSKQIQALEELMGVQLFNRSKREVRLTAAGAFLHQNAAFFLNQISDMLEQTALVAGGKVGKLKVGFVGSAMQNVIPDLILSCSRSFPDISFTFEEMSNALQVEHLKKGLIDLGFVRLDHVDSALKIQKIYEDTFSLVLPYDHPIDQSTYQGMRQFANENFILFQPKYSPAYYNEVKSICEDAGFSPKISHNSVHASTIYRLVENGLGISIVPTALREGYNMQVKFIELKAIRQKAELSIIYNKKNRNPSLNIILSLLESRLIKN